MTVPSSGLFDDLGSPEEEKKVATEKDFDSGLFTDLGSSEPTDSGLYADLGETTPEEVEKKPLVKALTEFAVAGPAGPALRGFKAQAALEEKAHGGEEQAPIYFNKRDLPANVIPEPITTMRAAGKVMEREEAAFSAPALALIDSAEKVHSGKMSYLDYVKEAPKTLWEGLSQGIHGDSRAEVDPARQAQIGDIYRALGAPEPVAATLGLATSLALPTQILMNYLSPGGRILSKAEGLAQNAVRMKALQALAKKDTAALMKNKDFIIKNLSMTWPDDTHIYLAKYKQDLLKAASDDEIKGVLTAASTAKKQAQALVASQKAAKPKSLMAHLGDAAHESFYFPYAIKSMLKAKDWDHPILQQVRKLQAAVTHHETGVNQGLDDWMKFKKTLGINGKIPDELAIEVKANHLFMDGEPKKLAIFLQDVGLYKGPLKTTREGKKVIDFAALKTTEGARTLTDSIPELSPKGQAIIAEAQRISKKDRALLAANYERHYGSPFKILENHSFPIHYRNVETTPLDLYGPSKGATGGVKGKFKTRVQTDYVPTHDLDTEIISQIRAQEMLKNVVPGVDNTRAFMAQSHIAPMLSDDQKRFMAHRLEFVLRGGLEIPNNTLDAGLRHISKNVVKGMLAWKASSFLLQGTAYIDAMNFANLTWGRKAGNHMLKKMGEILRPRFKQAALENSEALKLRLGTVGSDISMKESGKGGSLGMKPLQLADHHTAKVVRRNMESFLKKEKIPYTNDDLDFMMELSQGSSNTVMQPGVMTHDYNWKSWFTFQTFVLGRWSRMAVDALQQGIFAKDNIRRLDIATDRAFLRKPELLKESIGKRSWAVLSPPKVDTAGMSARQLKVVDKAKALATKKMEKDLKAYGYTAEKATSGFHNPITGQTSQDPVYFVPGMREDDAIKLARKYGGESIKTPRGEIDLKTMAYKEHDLAKTAIDKTVAPGDTYIERTIGGKKVKISIPEKTTAPTGATASPKSNWREAVDKSTNPSAQSAILRGIADISKSKQELMDVLARVKGVPDEANIRFAVEKNPAFKAPAPAGIPGVPKTLDPSRITFHVQPHDVIDKRINGFIGLMYVAAAEAVEQSIRNGIYRLVSGKENPKTIPEALMMAVPSQVPVLSSIIQSTMYGGSGLPPAFSTFYNAGRGVGGMIKGKTGKAKLRGAVSAATNILAAVKGVEGIGQVEQIAKGILRD